MTNQIYDKYLSVMRSMHRAHPNWYIIGSSIVRDTLLNEKSQHAYALIDLGPKVCRAILNENTDRITVSVIVQKVYDPFNRYNLNYNAYRFVTKIIADILGIDTDITIDSIGNNFAISEFLINGEEEKDPPDVARLKAYRNRLLDFSRGNQLVNFRKFDKSVIEFTYPSVDSIIGQLTSEDGGKIHIEHWENLGFTQISECKYCGNQYFRKYKKSEANTSTKCPVCDESKRQGAKSAKPIKEIPFDIASHPLKLKCECCGSETPIKKTPTDTVLCRACGTQLKLPGYPIYSSDKLKTKLTSFCIATCSDGVTSSAAYNLSRRARSMELNFGLHPLYLACGFLKWKSASNQDYLSPLLLLKINISLDSNGRYSISLDNTDEEPISVNHTLRKMLNRYSRENSVDLPKYVDSMSYSDYTLAVMDKLKDYPFAEDWVIENRAAAGIFNYQKLQLEKDITDNFDTYLRHPVVRLIGRFDDNVNLLAKPTGGSEDFLVLDADGSQSKVIDAAVAGKSFILQGPPGSGKSQTITNIIAGAMSVGKTVLFVTEKASARNIIWDNLSQIRLDGDRSLSEFIYNPSNMVATGKSKSKSSKLDKEAPSKTAFKKFYNDRFTERKQPIVFNTEMSSLDHLNAKFTELYDTLERKVGNYTIGGLISIWSQYAEEKDLDVKVKLGIGTADLQMLEEEITRFYRFASTFGVNYKVHPLYGYLETDPDLPSLPLIEESLRIKTEIDGHLNVLDQMMGITPSRKFDKLVDELFLIQKWLGMPEIIFAWASDWGLPLAEDIGKLRTMLQQKSKYAAGRTDTHNKSVDKRGAALAFANEIIAEEYDFDFKSLIRSFDAFQNPFSRLGKDYKVKKALALSKLVNPPEKLSYKQLIALLANIVTNQEAYFDCRSNEVMFNADATEFPGLADGWSTDWSRISELLKQALKIVDTRSTKLENETFRYLRGTRSFDVACESLKEITEQLKSAVKEELTLIRQAEASFDSKLFNPKDTTYSDVFEKFRDVVECKSLLTEWTRFSVFLNSISGKTAINAIIDSLGRLDVTDKDVAIRMLRKSFYQKLIIRELNAGGKDMSLFSSSDHEELIRQYLKIDVDQMYLDAVVTYNRLAKAKNDACEKHGGTKLVTNINGVSVKEIISKKWETVKTVTPCFMMSPLSVSQYLDIANKFDMVIFDEASQIFLEDSLASIVRGTQVIISGDRQQLPPSDFFRASDIETEDDSALFDEEAQESGRSVLDASIRSSIDEISLKWHYRSRDESLISFSNQYFYSGSLVTFPAALQDPELRLIYHHVDGVYRSGSQHTNPDEAKAVVDLIWQEINNPKRRHFTIGVVAFSVSQAIRIEEEWLDFVSNLSPQDKQVYQDWENMEEHRKDPLIFCNLDTIQGDERDTMIVSTTYGRNENGDFNLLYLGPVRQENGGKRINVAITRARSRMVVVTSMTSELLTAQLNKSAGKCNDGAALLCSFLKYAESYKNSRATAVSTNPSYLVKAICRILDECEADYDINVGLSSYKIELAVKSKKDPNRYVLGIMTDEQGLRTQTIREYARLRPQVMRDRYGWNLHRVWLLGWFFDYERERARLIRAVKDAIKN